MAINDDNIVYISIEVLVGILTVIGNSLVCYVFFESKSLRKKSMFIFLTSLAVADLLVGAVGIPFCILTKLGLPHNSPYLCSAMLGFIILLAQFTIFNLMTISIERYLAIRFPLIHFNKLTPKTSVRIIVITWMVSILFVIPPIVWNNFPTLFNDDSELVNSNHNTSLIPSQNYTHECFFVQNVSLDSMFFNFIVCVLMPLLVCAVLYSAILRSLLKEQSPTDKTFMRTNRARKAINSSSMLPRPENAVCKNNDNRMEKTLQQKVTIAKSSSGHNNNITLLKSSKQPNPSKKKKEIHAAIVLGMMVLMFAICWLPVHVLNAITRFADASAVQIPPWVFNIAIILTHVNSAVNFFLYSWRLKTFRNELNKKVITKLRNFFTKKLSLFRCHQ